MEEKMETYNSTSIENFLRGSARINLIQDKLRNIAKILEGLFKKNDLEIMKNQAFGKLKISLRTSKKGNLITEIRSGKNEKVWTGKETLPKEIAIEIYEKLPEIFDVIKKNFPEIGKDIDFIISQG